MSKKAQGRIMKGARGPKFEFELDDERCNAYQGETIATALIGAGKRTFRLSPKEKKPRGLYCGMGVCFECLVTVDGIPNVRACMTPVKPGMKVETFTKEDKPLRESSE